MAKRWTENELKILKNNYKDLSNKDLMRILPGRTYESITIKSGKLGLKKSDEIRSFLTGKRNKMVGRNLNFNIVKNIASNFKSRAEFQKIDPSAYVTARTKGWLDDVCYHMIPTSYSIPQIILYQIISSIFKNDVLYNDRIAIKPLELDVYVPDLNIAFEYNGKYWHQNEKNNKEIICQNNNIKLFTISENSRNYEKDIKEQILQIIEKINNYLGNNIQKKDILDVKIDLFLDIPDIKDIHIICMKYKNFSDFSKEEPVILRKIKKLKLLNELTSHMEKRRKKWTEKELKDEISKFSNLSDLIKNNFKVYLYCIKKYRDLLSPLSYKKGYEKRFIKTAKF
jgi:hypothetical protein